MKKMKLFSVLATVLGLFLSSASVFAANPYGIEYSGGEELGAGNVVEDPELISALRPLVIVSGSKLTFRGQWEDGYVIDGTCEKMKYFTVSKQNLFNTANDYSYSVQKGQYRMDVKVKSVAGEYATDNTYAVILLENKTFDVGYGVYKDANCENRISSIDVMGSNTGDKLFVETDIKLYKEGQTGVFTSDELYFALLDIDAGQSYKILNSADKLTAGKMYAKTLSALQPSDSSITVRNMFNPTGNYIYSDTPMFNLTANNHIYVNISTATQQEGLDVVFGFSEAAGSGVEYYAKQYTVTYESDEGGTITGITDEQVISGDTPFGSTEESKENYELDYWKADKDVTLTDGTVIKAGEPITMEQIKKVVVNEDLTFIAIHKTKVKVPDTGAFTEDVNGMLVSLPVIGILLGALMLGLLPKLTHKKISFKK